LIYTLYLHDALPIYKIIFLNHDDPKDLVHRYNLPHKKNAIEVLGPIGLNLQDFGYKKWDDQKEISFIFIARLIAEKGIFEYLEADRKSTRLNSSHVK